MVSAQRADMQNALSFDIEDWFHLVEVPGLSDTAKWDDLPSIVEQQTDWILDVLAQRSVRATFFILGWIAEKYPTLVGRIDAAGHEIASHAFWHRRIDQLNPQEFSEELGRSLEAIEKCCSSQKVRGFRAPSFSITPGSEWAMDVLLDHGLTYDASLFPASRDNGGYPDCPNHPHLFETPSGRTIREIPMSVASIGPLKLPFSGGGYLRLLPLTAIRWGFREFIRRDLPTVVYLHPRDFAVNCPRIKMPLARRFKSYVGLKSSRRKFLALLDEFDFVTCQELLERRGL